MTFLESLKDFGPVTVMSIIILLLKYPQIIETFFPKKTNGGSVKSDTDSIKLTKVNGHVFVEQDDCHNYMKDLKDTINSNHQAVMSSMNAGFSRADQRIDTLYRSLKGND